MRANRERGVTLPELLISVVVLGILSIAISPILNSYVVSMRGSYAKKQEVTNQTIGVSLLNFAADSTRLGELPPPFTGAGYVSTVFDPADASASGLALTGALTQSGINPSEINDDNYASHRVRVYQRVAGLNAVFPLAFQSGPVVTLTYQYAAIYMTACEKAKAVCNPAATGVPGTSAAMTKSNYSTWTSSGTDMPAYFVSTLPLQKQMLAGTNDKLNKIKDALLSHYRAQQRTAAGNDMSNFWLPFPGTKGGKAPGPNQGCRDGWYDLSTDQTILPGVGLTTTEYGQTAWGGPIEYCRDYDPTGNKAPDAAPHLAALRIHSSVSIGSAPDPAVMNNNVVLTF